MMWRIAATIVLGVLLWLAFAGSHDPLLARWTMIHVNEEVPADAHLLEITGGPTILIDTGYPTGNRLVAFLRARKIQTIDSVWITHAHRDHYGGLGLLLDAGFQIKQVRMTRPDRKVCDAESTWGCQYHEVEDVFARLVRERIPVSAIQAGERETWTQNATLDTLYAFDGVHTPVGTTDINDMSPILLLTVGGTRALFTGDLNASIGGYLAEHGKNLRAEILKVPHHGGESVAPNAFFDQVRARTAMVPAPRSLWAGDRTQRLKKYFAGTKTYVSGFHGHVQVLMRASGYEIVAERPL